MEMPRDIPREMRGNPAPAPGILQLASRVVVEAAGLAEDYSALAAARLRLSLRAYSATLALGAVSGTVAFIGLLHLGYGVVGVAFASLPAVRENAEVMLIAAIAYLVVAGVLAALTAGAAKSAGRQVRKLAGRTS